MRPPWLLAALLAPAGVAAAFVLPAGGAQTQAPEVTPIKAVFAAPATTYSVEVHDPSGRRVEYTWRLVPPPLEPECTNFRVQAVRSQAVWLHADEHGCDHTKQGPRGHQGEVHLTIRFDSGWTCTLRFEGTITDEGPPPACVPAPELTTTQPTTTDISVRPCRGTVSWGLFQPTQGVWQDDPTFADRPGKQISLVRAGRLHAELPMVEDRPALLFGVKRVARGPSDGLREGIVFRGVTFGTISAPVKVRFNRIDATGKTELFTRFAGRAPLYGMCGAAPQPWEIRVKTPRGLPPEPFTFPEPGRYTLEAELLDQNDHPIGLKSEVVGEVVSTNPPAVNFVGVRLARGDDEAGLRRETQSTANRAKRYVPHAFPIAPRELRVSAYSLVLDFTGLFVGDATVENFLLQKLGRRTPSTDLALAQLLRLVSGGALLGNADRVVAVATPAGFARIGTSEAAGFAPTAKVVFVLDVQGSQVVAHELAHTLPYVFSDAAMVAECGLDYHNKNLPVAHGIRITSGDPGGLPRLRQLIDGAESIMSTTGGEHWIDQCTYAHLLQQLRRRIDPPMTLVEGLVARSGGRTAGVLYPAYELDGVSDLRRGKRGRWAIVVRDRSGRLLARFPFEPVWTIDLERRRRPRSVVPVSYRIPRLPGAAAIELVGPSGVLDRLRVSRSRPQVRITSARIRGRRALVEWRGSDADGGACSTPSSTRPTGARRGFRSCTRRGARRSPSTWRRRGITRCASSRRTEPAAASPNACSRAEGTRRSHRRDPLTRSRGVSSRFERAFEMPEARLELGGRGPREADSASLLILLALPGFAAKAANAYGASSPSGSTSRPL